jgi:hypothetical protein
MDIVLEALPVESEPAGYVISVRGSRVKIGLCNSRPIGMEHPTFGSFLAMEGNDETLIGVVTHVEAAVISEPGPGSYQALASIDLIGEIARGSDGRMAFRRGVRAHPPIGDAAHILSSDAMRVVYGSLSSRTIEIGRLAQDQSIPVRVELDNLLSKHFAVVGSTGVGKSSGVAVIVNAIIAADPGLRVLVLDSHNEYGRSFGKMAYVTGASDQPPLSGPVGMLVH